MKLFGLTISRARPVAAPPAASERGGWFSVVHEPHIGAWQQNEELRPDSALANPTVFACVTLIASDIAKLRLRLVKQDEHGTWTEATSAAFSPVLRKPNRAQTTTKFVEGWMFSKLLHGNTYVLKQRDERGVVTALYVLDPLRVVPLVTPDGAVYYQLRQDAIAGVEQATDVVVPAREIIHDRFNCLFHPLVGVSPLFAAAGSATQGLKILDSSIRFFTNNARPSGVLRAPGEISKAIAADMKASWEAAYSGENYGRVAVLQQGVEYQAFSHTAVDSQLIEQDKRTTELICSAYHMPASLIDASHAPPYANSEPLMQMYYSQCLQTHIVSLETSLDDGLELPSPYGTEFDVDDLYWMDTSTRTKAAHDSIAAGALAPNEARAKYFGVGPVAGGDTPYLQQQYSSLASLAERPAPTPAPTFAPAPPAPADDDEPDDDEQDEKHFLDTLSKALEGLTYAA